MLWNTNASTTSQFFSEHSLISNEQHGFRPKHSCITAVICSTKNFRRSIISKNIGLACIVDLQKAFDTMNQDTFLMKLEHYGIRCKVLCWFKDFLVDRKQYVATILGSSDFRNFHCGVPQGSVLGPLLFFFNTLTICPLVAQFQTFVVLRMI